MNEVGIQPKIEIGAITVILIINSYVLYMTFLLLSQYLKPVKVMQKYH